MATPLQSASIAAPGFFGLNTQESGITLESGFALQANNCVIDKFGRLGARKGWQFLDEVTGVNLQGIHRFVDIDAQEYFGVWSNDTFYIYQNGTLNEAPYGGTQTLTEGNWQAVTLNDSAYLFQAGYEPLYFDEPNGTIEDISSHPNASGTPPEGNVALSAYGRLWTASTATNKTTLYWSDLLNGPRWNSGTAGSLDISGILVYGNDEIIALGAHNGFLIVFCKQNIIIFGDTDNNQQYLDPTTLQLVEVISGVGCIARDSIQNTGTDILFLSESGLRSLGRVIQEKSTPMRDLSKNVRDDLVQLLEAETNSKIKSAYSEGNAFYLLAFPTTRQVYCFDMRQPLEDGSARVTIWNNMDFTAWNAWENEVYMAHKDGLAEYRGYQDNGESYRMVYFTNYFDLGNASQVKLLKRLAITVIGATGQDFVVKSGFDYSDVYNNYPLTVKQATVAEYGGSPSITGTSATQSATTITDEDAIRSVDVDGNVTTADKHYTVDFKTSSTGNYTNAVVVYLDSDTYYYWDQDIGETRTATTLYLLPNTGNDQYNSSTEYTGGNLVDNVRVAGSGSGSVMQLGFEADLNGGALSIQKMDIYVKQGRTL